MKDNKKKAERENKKRFYPKILCMIDRILKKKEKKKIQSIASWTEFVKRIVHSATQFNQTFFHLIEFWGSKIIKKHWLLLRPVNDFET